MFRSIKNHHQVYALSSYVHYYYGHKYDLKFHTVCGSMCLQNI